MSKQKRTFGGGDVNFHGDCEGHIGTWLVSIPGRPETQEKVELGEGCLFNRPLPTEPSLDLQTLAFSPFPQRHLLEYEIDGLNVDARVFVNDQEAFRHAKIPQLSVGRFCVWIELTPGWNKLRFRLSAKTDGSPEASFQARVITEHGRVLAADHYAPTLEDAATFSLTPNSVRSQAATTPDRSFPFPQEKRFNDVPPSPNGPTLEDFQPGVGIAKKSAGRFGFSKGDGMLDCSMPVMGMFAKPYLFGHPDYQRSILWHFTTLPPGIDEHDQYIGSKHDWHALGSDETVDVNWLAVTWRKKFKTRKGFLHREAGTDVNVSYTYSLGATGVLMETDDAGLRLSGLGSAGDYRRLLLPLNETAVVRSTTEGGVIYDRSMDGDLREGWFMIWGNSSFPDVPILLTLQKNPEKIVCDRLPNGDLDSVDVIAHDAFGWAVLHFPYGFEVFDPAAIDNDAWIKEAMEQCDFLSRLALAYPIDCQESFRTDDAQDRVDVVQKFQHRRLTNEWGDNPLLSAPLPPPLSLIGDVSGVELDPDAVDFKFPTKYGFLMGALGRDWSRYSIPVPPTRREFQFRTPDDAATTKRALAADFDDYLDFHRSKPEVPNPGVYSFLLQYDIPMLLFNYLEEGNRRRLEQIIAEGLDKATNPDTEYPFIDGGTCHSWYPRRDPFTGLGYLTTYLHISGIRNLPSRSKKNIETFRGTFIELDWGNAMALYSIYLGALLTNDWEPVEKNWPTLRHAFDYYLHLQDWACMATAYRENGVTWNDGTNYGGYLGFIRMAEIIGDRTSQDWGKYAFAKLAALRLAQFRATQTYFHKYFNVAPWWIGKFFHEETDAAAAFTNVPEIIGRCRPQGLYNLTTEGHYPEAFAFYAKHLPEEVKEFLRIIDESFDDVTRAVPTVDGRDGYVSRGDWLGEQETYSFLLLSLLTGHQSPSELLMKLDRAAENHRLSRETLGAAFSHRRIPRNWVHCFLRSQIRGKILPLSLTGWRHVRIDAADYDPNEAIAVIRLTPKGDGEPWIELKATEKPKSILGDENPLDPKRITWTNGALRIATGEIRELTFMTT